MKIDQEYLTYMRDMPITPCLLKRWNTVKALIFTGILFRVFVILCLCKSKIRVLGRVVIENPLNIHRFYFYFRDNDTHAKISNFTVYVSGKSGMHDTDQRTANVSRSEATVECSSQVALHL
jgi:hypothetical protein